ncbi:MAG: hypothetical protein ACR2PG_07120 [Hyphomicrobiaceae bacterium]
MEEFLFVWPITVDGPFDGNPLEEHLTLSTEFSALLAIALAVPVRQPATIGLRHLFWPNWPVRTGSYGLTSVVTTYRLGSQTDLGRCND